MAVTRLRDGGDVSVRVLIVEDNKVRFEVNLDAAKQSDLNISSRLLALARIIPQAAADAR